MTTPKNGTLPKSQPAATTASKTVTNLAVVPTTKPEAKKETGDLKPLEDRLHRLNELFDLQRKYVTLQQSKQKLSAFKLSNDGESSYLKLQDDNRNDFTTGNPSIIKEIVKHLTTVIDAKIKELEPKLTW